jgi:hypothetical protein
VGGNLESIDLPALLVCRMHLQHPEPPGGERQVLGQAQGTLEGYH